MIPKKLHVIWIGDESKRPDEWIKTWQDKHPDWEYKIWGNKELEEHDWINKGIIEQYLKEKRYPGVADVMRYQILYEEGGMVHPADSTCVNSINELMTAPAIAVYENETVRPGFISPLYASEPHGMFVKTLIDNLPDTPPLAPHQSRTIERPSKAPVQVTGNIFMKNIVENYTKLTGRNLADDLVILPSYTFNPIHHTGLRYEGNGKVYAVQQWGSTSEAGIGVQKYDW